MEVLDTSINQCEIIDKMLSVITWQDICEARILNNRAEMLLREFHPETLEDMINIIACSLNTYIWEESDTDLIDLKRFREMIDSEEFQKYPCFVREHVTECLKEVGFEDESAFCISEMVRKRYAHSVLRYKYDSLALPPLIKRVTGYFKYLTYRERVEKMVGYLVSHTYAKKMKCMYANTLQDVELILHLL